MRFCKVNTVSVEPWSLLFVLGSLTLTSDVLRDVENFVIVTVTYLDQYLHLFSDP